ncbi:uncharacterized protein TNCV_971451 [Trichonephila clavipes]|nr:uncharacterized protein TNCV_971451 [Trichonephila clavipes]
MTDLVIESRSNDDTCSHQDSKQWLDCNNTDRKPLTITTQLQLVFSSEAAVAQWAWHGRHVISSSPVPLKNLRVGQRCAFYLSRAETSSRWCGVVVTRGVLAQVSSASLDHGSKLRGPSPKALA